MQIRCYLPPVPLALRSAPFQAAPYLLEVAGSPSLSSTLPAGTQSEAQHGARPISVRWRSTAGSTAGKGRMRAPRDVRFRRHLVPHNRRLYRVLGAIFETNAAFQLKQRSWGCTHYSTSAYIHLIAVAPAGNAPSERNEQSIRVR